MCILFIAKSLKLCFSLIMSKTMIYLHAYIILDFHITYRKASVLCQPECTGLHKTVNMVVFFVKSYESTYPKGRVLMQMYRVVPQTKIWKTLLVVTVFYYIRKETGTQQNEVNHLINCYISVDQEGILRRKQTTQLNM